MKRTLYQDLLKWKKGPNRKPLLLQGARQVGKTYLVNQFAKEEYPSFFAFNFERDPELRALFQNSLDPKFLINNLSLFAGKKIESENTLLFFDEIQVSPEALTSLKYFQEEVPEYHIIAAGSLLGVSIGKRSSFPVGKVSFLNLYPLSFIEFLFALGENLLARDLESRKSNIPYPDIIHNKLLDHYKHYLFVGGMPETVSNYVNLQDIHQVRTIQNQIIQAYERDFSKYSEKTQAIKTSEVWNSIPYQLARENKKFKYSTVRKNARSSTFEQSIEWLRKAGIIHVANQVENPKLPLSGYCDYTKFKIYLLDTGILGAMLKLSPEILLRPNEYYQQYHGAFIENYVATQLISAGISELFYWTSRSDAEVDFLLNIDNQIYPLEVKSGSSRNLKSLRSYQAKYNPVKILRTSPRTYSEADEFTNIPLYGIGGILGL